MTIGIRYAARSDVGMLREGNEDSAYAGAHLLAVADGMGGHVGGEIASAAAIGELRKLDTDMPADELLGALERTVKAANEKLSRMVESDPALQGMGTTLTAMLWSGSQVALVHIGDSRAYLLRDGSLYQITHDHTLVQSLVDEGRISPDVKMNYLASPPLVIAYALAGTMDFDFETDALGTDHAGNPVYLRDIWPSPQEVEATIAGAIRKDLFTAEYADVFAGDERWQGLQTPTGSTFEWDADSTYVRKPTYFDGMTMQLTPVADIHGARVLAKLGDSVTTRATTAWAVEPVNGGSPVSISYSTAPRAYTSDRAVISRSPIACSGLM